MSRTLAFSLVMLLPALALASPPDIEPGDQPDPSIYGGSAVEYCGWPTAVYLDMGGGACTGTLVHPSIVITAAHCPSSTSGTNVTVRFGEGFGGGERAVASTCYSNPGWTGSVGSQDYGYCRLAQPVNDVPIIPPAFGCDVSALSPGREVVIVGFGQSNNGGSGSKREVTTTIVGINEQAQIGGNGEDACYGDSGGPVYIKLGSEFGGDDTWRAFGITSGGGECGQGGIYSLMHVAIPWIEEHSGVDITPCHDGDGTWNPTPQCGAIPLDPANGAGSWASGCSDGPVSNFGGLCGDPFGAGEDPDPPSVAITSPTSGTMIEIPPGETQAAVTVEVAADDGDGFGVGSVRLLINGNDFPGNTDPEAPYSWELVFPAGGFVLEAVAEDWTGNEATSDPVAIGIDEPAPELPGDDGGDGDGEGEGEGEEGDAEAEGDGEDFGSEGGLDAGLEKADACNCSSEPSPTGWPLALLGLVGLTGVRRRRSPRA